MLAKKTVFVVGAGASKELHLPVGDELKDLIARKLRFSFPDGYNLQTGDVNIYNAVRWHLQQSQERDGNPFWTAGQAIASAMPQSISIDNYLHTHSADEKIVSMGKLAIASCILEAERSSIIFLDPRRGSGHKFGDSSGVWHNTFCKMITEGVQLSGIDNIFQNASFITFNYDRCIEHYLAIWLENYMRISQERAQDLVRSLIVVHPYGKIGKLPWQREEMISVPYGAEVQPQILFEVAGNIRTFTEQMEDETVQDRMKELLSEAQQIVYLGFSFGSMNMALMRLNKSECSKRAYGTCLGMSEPNLNVVTHQLLQDMKVDGRPYMHSHSFERDTCNNLLNNYFRVLTN